RLPPPRTSTLTLHDALPIWIVRNRVAALPDGTWTTQDYVDFDPAHGEGLVPVQVRMTIDGDRVSYDLNGSAPAVESFLNAGYGRSAEHTYELQSREKLVCRL